MFAWLGAVPPPGRQASERPVALLAARISGEVELLHPRAQRVTLLGERIDDRNFAPKVTKHMEED